MPVSHQASVKGVFLSFGIRTRLYVQCPLDFTLKVELGVGRNEMNCSRLLKDGGIHYPPHSNSPLPVPIDVLVTFLARGIIIENLLFAKLLKSRKILLIPAPFCYKQTCSAHWLCSITRYLLVPAVLIQTDQSKQWEVNNMFHGCLKVK